MHGDKETASDYPLLQSHGKMVVVEWEGVVPGIRWLMHEDLHLSLSSVWMGILQTP